jgi:DNA-binding CsgD family transcriptional regulator/tetratricopeptide (TPR) repeat protein
MSTIPDVTPVERDRELTMLRETWREAVLGRGGMLVVSGEAGAGKTTLVQHFAGESDGGMRVLWGACDPLATPRPLGPFHDMAAALTVETARQLREATQPHDIFAAVYDELRERPSLLVVDDLHWSDQGTIDLLRFLLRRIESTGSLVVGTVRDDELGVDHPVRTLLGDAARSPRAGSIALRPLTVQGVAALAGERPVDPERLHARTGGNAFFVTELLEHGTDDLPATIRDAVLARTAGLSSDAWDLLHLLVCAPEAIPDQLLVALGVGFPPLRSLHELGLIRRGHRGIAFRHDLSRVAVASTVAPGIEPMLHRRLLDALEAFPAADPAVLAHHAIGAGDAVAILRHSAAAGRLAARSGAHTQAAEFYARALERAAAAPASDRAELLEAVATEYYLIDRLDDAISASARAMRVREGAGDRVGMATNHQALAVYHWYNAERDKADEHARAAVDVLDAADQPPDDRSVLGHAFAMQAFLSLHSSDLTAAHASIARAQCEADATDEPTIGVRVKLIDGLLGVVEGDAASRTKVVAVLDRAGDDYDEVYSSGYSNLGFLDVEQRRFGDAADLLDRSIAMSVERDLPICRVWQIGARGRLKLLTGDWDGALTDADEVLSERSAPLARFWPHLERAIVGLRRQGDPGQELDAAWSLATRYGEQLRWFHAAAVVVERAWLTGQPDDRLDVCAALLDEPPVAGQEWARGELAMWLHRLHRESRPPRPVGVAEPYACELGGDPAGAAAAWDALGAPFERALALVQTRDPDAARSAVDTLDRLGADAVAAKVRSVLRADGIVSVPARRRAATRAHPAGLTARQEEVLRHMSHGLTNAELADTLYISAKTVDHHVSAILTKLGVASRREAVRSSREMGLLD